MFIITKTPIKDVLIIEPQVYEDNRGYFMETYQERVFEEAGIPSKFVQINESFSKKGVLRGLHYQSKNPQAKLVRAVQGRIFDVVVDLRTGSPTFGQYYSVILSEDNQQQLYIPEGFAHGFFVLSDVARVIYKCSTYYEMEHQKGIIWNDSEVDIPWPIHNEERVLLSLQDQSHPSLAELLENQQSEFIEYNS